MVTETDADPFEALVAQGVSAKAMDPSAEPTVVGLPDEHEEEVVWLVAPEVDVAPAPAPPSAAAPTLFEDEPQVPEPKLPPPSKARWVALGSIAALLLGGSALVFVMNRPSPQVQWLDDAELAPLPPAPAKPATPEVVLIERSVPQVKPQAAVPPPAQTQARPSGARAKSKRATQTQSEFLTWPGEPKTTTQPPRDGEALKRPAM